MDIFETKTWYWGIENIDSVKLVNFSLSSEVCEVNFDELNGFRKGILKSYFKYILKIYEECAFKTIKLESNTKIGDYRLYGGTEIFDVSEEFQKKILDLTKKISELHFDGEIKSEHIIKTCQLAINKILESDKNGNK